jgi:hypothetical protein
MSLSQRKPPAQGERSSSGWTNFIPTSFIGDTSIKWALKALILVLETMARDRAWCFVRKAQLAEQLGCSMHTLDARLAEAVERGLIRRDTRGSDLIIVLLKRAADHLPVATNETFDQIVSDAWASRKRGGRKPATVPFVPRIHKTPADNGMQPPQKLGCNHPKIWGASHCSEGFPRASGETTEETTTEEPPGKTSSSCSDSLSRNGTQIPDAEAPAALDGIDALVDRITNFPFENPAEVPSRGKIEWAAKRFTVPLVNLAADEAERHNRKPGNRRVQGWGYFAQTLFNFAREGTQPPADRAVKPLPPAVRKEEQRVSPEEQAVVADGLWACIPGLRPTRR